MDHHTTLRAGAALRGGFIWLAVLVLACGAAVAEHLPEGFYGKEPPAWQHTGIEAALRAPSVWVQGHMLSECTERGWIAHLHISPAQWLLWLDHPEPEVRDVAARAAGQLGAQMPPEVQRALLRLQTLPGGNFDVERTALQALSQTGAGLIPEAQVAELARLQQPQGGYEMERLVLQTLGGCGAAMSPEVLQKLLSLMQDAHTAMAVRCSAAEALSHLGTHMPAHVQEGMLRTLLDPQADSTLRGTAAKALGHLGAQMPPQALRHLLDVLRDRTAGRSQRLCAAAALGHFGAQTPPEAQEALLAAHDEPPAAGADEDTIKDHEIFHRRVAESLGALGSDMPLAVQHTLLSRFLKTARTPKPDYSTLHALQQAGPHADTAALHTLLSGLHDEEIDAQARLSISDFFQRLAGHGHLPLEVQSAVIALVKSENTGRDARCQAALILGHLGENTTAEARKALSDLLRGGDPLLRIYSLQAMALLGPHMPQEAVPVLLTILKKRASVTSTALPAGDISALVPTGGFLPALDPLDYVVPALGQLGPHMPQEAPAGLLAVLLNKQAPRMACALALARLGDSLPAQIQQSLLAQLHQTQQDPALCRAICLTLGVSGLHPVPDALLADALSLTYEQTLDPDQLGAFLYLWLGRSTAHLLAVRWLGRTDTAPSLGDTPPQDILHLISRFWPHSAGADAPHTALRHAMARRTRQLLTTSLKTRPLDEPTRKVLRALSTQLATDPAPDCAAALKQVQAALGQDTSK